MECDIQNRALPTQKPVPQIVIGVQQFPCPTPRMYKFVNI